MMFSERLQYGKYYFQHLQGALRCVYGHQKPDVLGAHNEDQSGWGPNGSLLPSQNKHCGNFSTRRKKNFRWRKNLIFFWTSEYFYTNKIYIFSTIQPLSKEWHAKQFTDPLPRPEGQITVFLYELENVCNWQISMRTCGLKTHQKSPSH